MEQVRVKDMVRAAGGTLLYGDGERLLANIRFDSREVERDDLFVPIIGEKVDAHCFLEQVVGKGAGAVFTSRHTKEEVEEIMQRLEAGREESSCQEPGLQTAWVQVENTVYALQAVGSFLRDRLQVPVIGITGSVGKTTTREMTAAALSGELFVFQTPGNANSQVGVPKTISEIKACHQAVVLELGMSEPGELTRIAKIARPSVAVITNVGIAHMEQLGSKENICREKLTIQDGLAEGGTLLLNGDDDMLQHIRAREGHGYRTLYYGTGENCDYLARDIKEIDGGLSFTAVFRQECVPVRLSVPGRHNVWNAMAAIGAAHEAGVSMAAAAAGIRTFSGVEGRQQMIESQGLTVIDDTYNASPVSMKASIAILCGLKGVKRRVAVLADMKELGADSKELHRDVGRYLGKSSVDVLVTYGELAGSIAEGAKGGMEKGEGGPEIYEFLNKGEMTDFLKSLLREGDGILFKGSHSMRLGEIVAYFAGKEDKV
ncbi:UDP-N-acetylmuramoyl-tripeptide--D-alanyl-D-alanine ligase [Lachnospiraceae bacterium 62-35]